jgi:hypothetical protein
MLGRVVAVDAPVKGAVMGMSATEVVAAAGPLVPAVVSATWGRVTTMVEMV